MVRLAAASFVVLYRKGNRAQPPARAFLHDAMSWSVGLGLGPVVVRFYLGAAGLVGRRLAPGRAARRMKCCTLSVLVKQNANRTLTSTVRASSEELGSWRSLFTRWTMRSHRVGLSFYLPFVIVGKFRFSENRLTPFSSGAILATLKTSTFFLETVSRSFDVIVLQVLACYCT